MKNSIYQGFTRVRNFSAFLVTSCLLVGLFGCGVESLFTPQTDSKVYIELFPVSRTVSPGERTTLIARETITETKEGKTSAVFNSDPTTFDWTLVENRGDLRVESGPKYVFVAPETRGTYHVKVTSRRDSSQSSISTFIVE